MISKSTKSDTLSVRVTPDVMQYIDSFPGRTRAERFSYMIRLFKNEEKEKRKTLQRMDDWINAKQKKIDEETQLLYDILDIKETARMFDAASKRLAESVKKIMREESDSIPFGENTE